MLVRRTDFQRLLLDLAFVGRPIDEKPYIERKSRIHITRADDGQSTSVRFISVMSPGLAGSLV
jgi:hypothetical protein